MGSILKEPGHSVHPGIAKGVNVEPSLSCGPGTPTSTVVDDLSDLRGVKLHYEHNLAISHVVMHHFHGQEDLEHIFTFLA